jgi:ABC-2 type transport system permease protein
MAYVVISVFLLISGFLFSQIVLFASSQSMQLMRLQGALPEINVIELVFRPAFHNMAIVILFTLPLLTMRLLAEEKKTKTVELLFTSPISILEIIFGKFLAAFSVFSLMLLLTGFMPVLINIYGDLQWKPILAGYLGLLLLGGVILSVGLFASSITENQIIAGFVGFGITLLLWLMGIASQGAGNSVLGDILSFLSVGEHFSSFVKGLIDTKNVVYLLSLATVGLFLTHRVIEAHRWK